MSLPDVEKFQELGKFSSVKTETVNACKVFLKVLYGVKLPNIQTCAQMRSYLVFKYVFFILFLHFFRGGGNRKEG